MPCTQGLLVLLQTLCLPTLCLIQFLCQLDCKLQRHPWRVVTTSLCYCSEFPSLRPPMTRFRVPVNWGHNSFSVVINGVTNTVCWFVRHSYLVHSKEFNIKIRLKLGDSGEIDNDQWKMPQSWHKDLALASDQGIKLRCFINLIGETNEQLSIT